MISDDPDVDALNAMLARNWWLIAFRGTITLLFGLFALSRPEGVMLTLALYFAGYLIVDGAFCILSAVAAARDGESWEMLLAEGVLNLAAGLLAAILPGTAVLGFVLLVAAWALLCGAAMLGASFRLRTSHGRRWLALGAIVSMIWGAMLVIAPMIGAVVFTWWLGAYAIAFSLPLFALAFRLRAANHPARGEPTRLADAA
jgi:uncharacterized membrane protein HdeD (DUF308 family)